MLFKKKTKAMAVGLFNSTVKTETFFSLFHRGFYEKSEPV